MKVRFDSINAELKKAEINIIRDPITNKKVSSEFEITLVVPNEDVFFEEIENKENQTLCQVSGVAIPNGKLFKKRF